MIEPRMSSVCFTAGGVVLQVCILLKAMVVVTYVY